MGIADGLAVLMFGFAVTGFLRLLAWQSLFPSRRDYMALAGLPVRPPQIFVARFASVLLLSLAITLAMGFFACRDGASSIYSAAGLTWQWPGWWQASTKRTVAEPSRLELVRVGA